jgi:hypothetical protein
MLWIPDMKLPDVEWAEQLKAKEAMTASNPFVAVAKRKKEKIHQLRERRRRSISHKQRMIPKSCGIQ